MSDTEHRPNPTDATTVSGGDGAAGNAARASDELIRAALSEVYDPEIGIDIVSLGLVYGTRFEDNGMLVIDMTLTTPYCPLGPIIQTQAHAVCSPLPGVRDVRVDLVWSPPWDPRTMASEEAKLELGIY
ncbi:MAG: metal-sulfur cluster assembly factor [Candidatus Dormibacteraeota bacterium]|nr:metal-sulfur cluster assembly factor [Candidatus Dormibacteraeota bacterium]